MANILLGLEVTLIGFSLTMLSLYFLYLILAGFSYLQQRPDSVEVVAETAKPLKVLQSESPKDKACPSELVAVITASISSYLRKSPPEFAVISVRPQKTNFHSDWVTAGRNNLLENRRQIIWRKERRS
ncbi:MAG: OadG family protein [Firmicutes bacterium]|nr:OadG family protein [Bacillota bacterium]